MLMFVIVFQNFAQWEQVAPPDAIINCAFAKGDSVYFASSYGIFYKTKNSIDSVKILKNSPWLKSFLIKEDTIYGVIGNILFYSVNDGNTWNAKHIEGVGDGLQLSNLFIENNKLYVSDFHTFAYSEDGGQSWKLPESGYTKEGISALIVMGNKVIISNWNSDFYISMDGGRNFSKKQFGNGFGYINSFSRSENNIYALTNNSTLIYSQDTCKTWKSIDAPNDEIIINFYLYGHRIYIRTFDNNIYYTENQGLQWIDTGLSSNYNVIGDDTDDIIVADSTIYINTIKGWLRANPEKNMTYQLLSKNLLPRQCVNISNIDEHVIFVNQNKTFYIVDEENYKLLTLPNRFYLTFKIDSSSFTLWDAVADRYYLAVDNANTLSVVPTKMKNDIWTGSGKKTNDYVFFIKSDRKSLMRYNFKTGDTTSISLPSYYHGLNPIRALVVNKNIVVITGFFKNLSISDNFGNTWIHTGINIPEEYGAISALTFDNDILIALTLNGYLCSSNDYGMSWNVLSSNPLLPKSNVNYITQVYKKGDFIACGSHNGSNFNNTVYSSDAGLNFKPLIDELKIIDYPEFSNEILSLSMTEKYFWVGCAKGGFRYDLSPFTSALEDDINKKQENMDYTLSPNPAKDELYCSTSISETRNLNIINSMGQKVKSGKINGDTLISIADLPIGVYFFTISDNRNLSMSKAFFKL